MNQGKEKTMFKTKLQYVSWNDSVPGSAKAADTKKTKLENQGYILVSTQAGLFSEEKMYTLPEFEEAVLEYKKGKKEKLYSMIVPAEEAVLKIMPRPKP